MRTDCMDRFSRYTVGQLSKRSWFGNLLNMLTIFVPFVTLIFFNGGIVLMLKKQNVQVSGTGGGWSIKHGMRLATPLTANGAHNGS